MARQTKTFTLDVHHEDDGSYWAEVVELPGCFASGFSLDELYEGVAEAIGLYLSEPGKSIEVHLDDGVSREKRTFELCDA